MPVNCNAVLPAVQCSIYNNNTNYMEQSHLWEVTQVVGQYPAFCGTQSFITVFSRARHLSLSVPDASNQH
jgi:hypothetical protein